MDGAVSVEIYRKIGEATGGAEVTYDTDDNKRKAVSKSKELKKDICGRTWLVNFMPTTLQEAEQKPLKDGHNKSLDIFGGVKSKVRMNMKERHLLDDVVIAVLDTQSMTLDWKVRAEDIDDPVKLQEGRTAMTDSSGEVGTTRSYERLNICSWNVNGATCW